jgi:hypothetical protein
MTNCQANEYISIPGVPSVSNNVCESLLVCTEIQYELTAPTATTNRVCANITECVRLAFQIAAPTAISDRLCMCPECSAECADLQLLSCQVINNNRYISGAFVTFLGNSVVERIEGDFTFSANSLLARIEFTSLQLIQGFHTIETNNVLRSIKFDSLSSVSGFRIDRNPTLTRVEYASLSQIAQFFILRQNAALTFASFPLLSSFQGVILICENANSFVVPLAKHFVRSAMAARLAPRIFARRNVLSVSLHLMVFFGCGLLNRN